MAVNEQNYVDEAERVILKLKNMKRPNGYAVPMVTMTKLRNLLAMATDIYNEVMNQKSENLTEDLCSRIEYLRVRFLYEAGREEAVRRFVEESDMINVLKDIRTSKKRYLVFHRYLEALIAFHKYHGGKD